MILRIKDFIKNTENCTPAFVEAVSSLGDGDTLMLDGGRYHLYADGALEREYYISNNDCGIKPIVMPVINKKNITIDGGGAELVFHGMVLPCVIDGSENVTVKNLSVDYNVPLYAQAEIVEADEKGIVLKFDGRDFCCRVNNGNFCFYSNEDGWEREVESALCLEFDRNRAPSAFSPPYFPYTGAPKDHGFLSRMFKDVTLEELGDNLIAMRCGMGKYHTVGNYFIMTYMSREFPGFFINSSKDVRLCEINLYHTAAMGVIAQTTENISLEKVVANPRENSGRVLSVNADATHFVNCRGKISISDCKLVHMMDDAVNIHGIYNLYEERLSDDTLKLGFGHYQQKGVQIYRDDDLVAVIDSKTNRVVTEGRVVSARLISPEHISLRLDRTVPEPEEHWICENLTTAPDVHIKDTESGYNRPRGFLLSSSGRVLVERCRFYNMNQGIQLSGEMKDWYESGCVRDVTIRDCDFENSAYAGGVAILCKPVLRADDLLDKPFNGRVVVENNRFVQSKKRICAIDLCESVVFRNNSFRQDKSLPDKGQHRDGGVSFDRCGEVLFEDVVDVYDK